MMKRSSSRYYQSADTFYSLLFFVLRFSLCWSKSASTQVVIGVDGGTESIRACCFDAITGQVVGKACAVGYTTYHPKPGWAEQDPLDWVENLGQAVRGAVKSIPRGCEILSIAIDTTCCSVVALDDNYEPLRPCLLWMDQRSAPQTKKILDKCRGDPALKVNCGGKGPISAEWMTPKALWIHDNEPDVWNKAATICEYQDYINYKLTGVLCASSCNAASRWHWNGEECIREDDGSHPGRPLSLYKKLGIPELAEKLPQKCLPMGALVGQLTPEASNLLGLPEGLPVVQGGPDAFVGMVGLGCIHPGQLCLITGSSHLHCVVTSKPSTAPGTWGAYRGAPLPGINFSEGGQSSTGSIIRWARLLFGNQESYAELDNEAEQVEPGSHGLVALETFQGSRTPVTDPLARGAMMGLTLSHTRAHMWRALMEAVCFGTRACIEGLAAAGHQCDEIIIAGGATRSKLWLQMHADVTGKPVVVCENTDAPLLGCAILASVGVGVHDSVDDAVKKMVRRARQLDPDPSNASVYDNLYKNVYCLVANAANPVAHAIHDYEHSTALATALNLSGGKTQTRDASYDTTVSPSLLACDWANIRGEVHRCLKAGATRLHVDVFDGVFLDSPLALTFGPQMVTAIRRSCDSFGHGTRAVLDLHVCVDRPARFVSPIAEAGGDRFVFQFEAMNNLEDAISLATDINGAGMKCGVSINPTTDVEAVFPLLETNLVDLVDVLAVEPGFGGQAFQPVALEKVRKLRDWRLKSMIDFDIMVDGGVNHVTARSMVNAGANVLVSGTFLFKHPGGMSKGIQDLLAESD